jgi:RNA polymerase sigma factor (sigma-70 family)
MKGLARNITEFTSIRGHGRSAAFWNYVNETYPREALRVKHLTGKARDEFTKELVRRRDALKKARGANREKAEKAYLEYQNLSIEQNFRFILKCAAKYSISVPTAKFDDLVQECVLGWQRSIKNYDPAKSKLTTHAAYWIYQAVQRFIFNDSLIHVPEYLFEQLGRLDRQGIEVPEDVSERMKETFRLARRSSAKSSYVSLDSLLHDDGGTTFEDMLIDEKAPDPVNVVYHSEMSAILQSAMTVLRPRERDIITRRFGLSGKGGGESLDEIGERWGLTRERIRQIEVRALERLRIELDFGGKHKRIVAERVVLTVIQGGGE